MVLTSLTRCSMRLLRRPNTFLTNSRLCSSDSKPKSNQDFPNFTTKGRHSKDFEKFIKSPGIRTFAGVLVYGMPNPGRISDFDMQANELIDGSLLAINAVTQIIAHEPNIEESELSDFLTADCFEKIKSLLTENQKVRANRELFDTPKEDILLAFIEEYGIRDGAKKAKIVTMSFPLYSWLKEAYEENQRLKDEFARKLAEDVASGNAKFTQGFNQIDKASPEGFVQIAPYFDHNVIIVGNWDLVQVSSY